MTDKQGTRFNAGKARWDLLPAGALSELVNVFTFGAKKYEDENWRKGLKFKDTFRAILSHSFKWLSGEQRDTESGCHHLAHAAWNALVLVEFEMVGRKDLDDRATGVAPVAGTEEIKEPHQKLSEGSSASSAKPSDTKPCEGNIYTGPHTSCAVTFGEDQCPCCCITCVVAYRAKQGQLEQMTFQVTREDGKKSNTITIVGEKPKASTDSTVLKKRRTRDGFEVCKHDNYTKFHRTFNNPCACCGDAMVAPDPMIDDRCWACQDDPAKAERAKKAMTGEKK